MLWYISFGLIAFTNNVMTQIQNEANHMLMILAGVCTELKFKQCKNKHMIVTERLFLYDNLTLLSICRLIATK